MSYVRYGGSALHPTPAQARAREEFAERSRQAGALMREGHSKMEAWALVTGKAPSARAVHHAKAVAKKPRAKKAVAKVAPEEGGAVLGGAMLGGLMHHRHHAKKHSVHHRLRVHM